MKKIFIKAHKMTREIVERYKVNYQAQFGLCVSYLLEEKEEEEEVLKKLQGSEKQIKWANELLAKLEKYVDRVREGYEKGEALEEEKEEFNKFYNQSIKPILENQKSWEIIDRLKERTKKLWLLEDESYLDNLMNEMDNDKVEFEYNLADNIVYELEKLFK